MGVLASGSKVDILDLKHEDGPASGLIDLAERYVFSNVRRRLVIKGDAAREKSLKYQGRLFARQL